MHLKEKEMLKEYQDALDRQTKRFDQQNAQQNVQIAQMNKKFDELRETILAAQNNNPNDSQNSTSSNNTPITIQQN